MQIRNAELSDIQTIMSFTTDTFTWGDYVPSMIETWIGEEQSATLVAVDATDRPIALARATFLTHNEVWVHAIRVHTEQRGRGVAGVLIESLVDWATDHGGQVLRMLIEDGNDPSFRHAQKSGFRDVVTLFRATRPIDDTPPNPGGNGGGYRRSVLKLEAATVQDTQLVSSAWATSTSGRSMRQLVASGWRFHRLNDDDIETAARQKSLWQASGSWVIGAAVDHSFEVSMVNTEPDEAYDIIHAIVDTAVKQQATSSTMWLADLDWLVSAAERAGYDLDGYRIWERPL